jgi:ADP-heptose:LPS heptosyltransferase
VIRFDRHRFASAGWNPAALLELVRFGKDLRPRHFDLVIDLQGLFRSGFTTGIVRSPLRIGFSNAREMAWVFYTHRVPVGSTEPARAGSISARVRSPGCGRDPVEFVFAIDDDDRDAARRLTRGRRALRGPDSRHQLGDEAMAGSSIFAALVQPLRERFGLQSIVAGSRSETETGRPDPGNDQRRGSDKSEATGCNYWSRPTWSLPTTAARCTSPPR